MPMSTYAANKTLDFWLRGVAMVAPTAVYISLHTADPGNSGANEVSLVAWPAYIRKDPAAGGAIATGWLAAAAKATTNLLDMLWPGNNGAGAITITHFGIWDAPTAGNFIIGDAITVPRTLQPTDQNIAKAGVITVTVI